MSDSSLCRANYQSLSVHQNNFSSIQGIFSFLKEVERIQLLKPGIFMALMITITNFCLIHKQNKNFVTKDQDHINAILRQLKATKFIIHLKDSKHIFFIKQSIHTTCHIYFSKLLIFLVLYVASMRNVIFE